MAWWIWALGSPPPDPTTRPESRLGPRGRVSAGEGPGGLWGDVLSTHCEEAGDVTCRRVDWPSASRLAKDDAVGVSAPWSLSSPQVLGPLCQAGTS
jgi:hypothetical protein